MTKLTDEQFKEIFGEYKSSIVIEQDSNPEITQESSNDLVTITMNLVVPGQLMDASNIPTLDDIKDEKPEVKANADVIMANYLNRSIEQIHLVDDVISNGYSSIESAILWLEVINTNINQLMGLAGVNNYLLGIMGSGVWPIDKIINGESQNINVSDKQTAEAVLVNANTVIGTTMGIFGAVGTLLGGPAGTAIGTLVGAVFGSMLYVMARNYEDIDWSGTYRYGSWDYVPPGNDAKLFIL